MLAVLCHALYVVGFVTDVKTKHAQVVAVGEKKGLENVFPSESNDDWTVIFEYLRQRNLSGGCNLSQALWYANAFNNTGNPKHKG